MMSQTNFNDSKHTLQTMTECEFEKKKQQTDREKTRFDEYYKSKGYTYQ